MNHQFELEKFSAAQKAKFVCETYQHQHRMESSIQTIQTYWLNNFFYLLYKQSVDSIKKVIGKSEVYLRWLISKTIQIDCDFLDYRDDNEKETEWRFYYVPFECYHAPNIPECCHM